MTTRQTNNLLTKFIVNKPGKVEGKLDRFRKAGKNQIHYLFDFDRTITTSAQKGKDITIWSLLDDLLPNESRPVYDKASQRYQNMEFEGKLSEEDAKAWWALSFELYIQHGMNLNQIKQALRKLKVREGAIELFALCESNNIPTIILSAGVGDVIEIITQEHNMHPTAILSTKLYVAPDGRIIGWDPDSVVHILNKQEKGHSRLSQIREQRPFTILIGDSLEDARMVEGDETVLRIRVSDGPKKGQQQEQYIKASFDAGFDMIVEHDLVPTLELTKYLINRS